MSCLCVSLVRCGAVCGIPPKFIWIAWRMESLDGGLRLRMDNYCTCMHGAWEEKEM